MAEALLFTVTVEILKKVSFIATQEIDPVWGVKRGLRRLQDKLSMIQDVLEDAEERQVREEEVRLWLIRLKYAAYDADDILDEFAYETLRKRVTKNGIKEKVRNFISLPKKLQFRIKMAFEIKRINRKLDDIAREKQKFQFRSVGSVDVDTSHGIIEHGETFYFVDDSEVVGREEEKSFIVDMLINHPNDQEKVSVIPIVGIGGLGKTTLAQLVYNDKLVEMHFDLRLWVCVSDDFDVKRLLKEITESITKDKCSLSNMDEIICSLQEKMKGKKFLLVLDDVWNEDHEKWDKLKNSLRGGGVGGSKIIVTTRIERVASIMGTLPTHHLQTLSKDESWYLFKQRAFGIGGPEETPNLVTIGREIVEKCGGVPLAAKTLGGLMHSKREERDWMLIRESELWDIPGDRSGVIAALKLSYNHLPSHLKQCFSYCSIFPKNYVIEKEKLIQLWMAEDLLQPSTVSKQVKANIGDEYFNSLLQNCFFQAEVKNLFGDVESCKMHDLVHDLASSVRGPECSIVGASRVGENISEIRHLSLVSEFSKTELTTIPKVLSKLKKLHTFLLDVECESDHILNDMFLSFKCLRTLDLSCAGIRELPTSIKRLKHLRYLDLQGNTSLEILPKAITSLYNLQTLNLKSCSYLRELPRDLSKLTKLRHFIISDTGNWTQMPRQIGRLSCLQTLSVFKVGQEHGYNIGELEYLNRLRGKLRIYNLENVRVGNDAKDANLQCKPDIRQLELKWGRQSDDEDRENNDDGVVLEGLQPHINLKELHIDGFMGVKFPTWMTTATLSPNLVHISLNSCLECESFPTLGQLPSLKVLELFDMNAVKHLGREFYCSSSSTEEEDEEEEAIAFPSLKELSIQRMPNLEEWELFHCSFRYLEELTIDSCPKLTIGSNVFPCLKKSMVFPTLKKSMVFPSLKKFEVTDSNGLVLHSELTSLTSLMLYEIQDLTYLPQGFLQNSKFLQSLKIVECPNFQAFYPNEEKGLSSSSLNYLEINDCPVLESVPDIGGLTSLKSLVIIYCGQLKSLPEGLQDLTALEELRIGGFSRKLASFPFPALAVDKDTIIHHLFYLRKLEIIGWDELEILPDQLQYLTTLQELKITSFAGLRDLPEWLGNFSSLQRLQLFICTNLMRMPSENGMKRLTTLQSLEILDCPRLEKCFLEKGEEWDKVAHIQNIKIGFEFAKQDKKRRLNQASYSRYSSSSWVDSAEIQRGEPEASLPVAC